MKIGLIIFTTLFSANTFAQTVADKTEALSMPISQAQAATQELLSALSPENLGFVLDGESVKKFPKQGEFKKKKDLYLRSVNEAGQNFRVKLRILMSTALDIENKLKAIRAKPRFCNGFEGNDPSVLSSDHCKKTWGWQRGMTELRFEFTVTAYRSLLENDEPFIESLTTDSFIRKNNGYGYANLAEAVNYFDGYVVQTFGDADRAAMEEMVKELSSKFGRFEQSVQRLLYMNLDTSEPLKPQISEAGEAL